MLLELAPFAVCRFPVLGLGAHGPALGEEGAVGPDELVLEDCEVGLSGGDAAMAEDLRGDVDGEAAGDGLGGGQIEIDRTSVSTTRGATNS